MSEINSEARQGSMEVFFNGLVKENPTFVLALGMCPTLAVTTSAVNGLGMGLTTTAVLVLSNAIISLLRHIIPNRVRIPAFIVIVASFVTMVELLLEGFIPSLYAALGLYIPLIVVNCIILGRAESFASKNPVIPSIFDGLGMGLGFTVALTAIGAVRELLGAGEFFGVPVINKVLGGISSMIGRQEPIEYVPISIFVRSSCLPHSRRCRTASRERCRKRGRTRTGSSQAAVRTVQAAPTAAARTALSMWTGSLVPWRTRKRSRRRIYAQREMRRKERKMLDVVKDLLILMISSSLVSNVVLSQFLGLCPFLGVSKKVDTALGMGGAVIFVITIASGVAAVIYKVILERFDITYLQTIVFILVIAALVQFVEMFLKKYVTSLYQALGVYLPLITTNCAVLGIALTNVQKNYGIGFSIASGLFTAVGFLIAIVVLAGIREKMEYNDIPESFKGMPIVLITAGLMAIAFCGFSGLL